MSEELDSARRFFEEGKYRKAVDKLRYVETNSRTDLDEARGLLALASEIRAVTDGGVHRECDDLVVSAESIIDREQEAQRDHLAAIGFCPACGSPYQSEDDSFCRACGVGRRGRTVPTCGRCGTELGERDTFCGSCGATISDGAAAGMLDAATRVMRPAAVARSAAWQAPNPGAPGIGVAGFVLSLLGFSVIGLILAWAGYAQAKREGRPTGLCVAGIVLGFVGLAISVVVVLLMAGIFASAPTYYGE